MVKLRKFQHASINGFEGMAQKVIWREALAQL